MKTQTYGAKPSDKVSPAPCGVVRWNVTLRGVPVSPVDAHSWFKARDIAMARHQCEWADLEINQQGNV